jgi:hypothetical protein
MDYIDLAQDRDHMEGSCKHCNELSGPLKCEEVLE